MVIPDSVGRDIIVGLLRPVIRATLAIFSPLATSFTIIFSWSRVTLKYTPSGLPPQMIR
jgi:hypothetical protein